VPGFTLKFWKQSTWNNDDYREVFTHFFFFHILLVFIILCLVKTAFSNPGYINKEYFKHYSVITFIKVYFVYILNPEEKINPKLEENHISELNNILKLKKNILETIKKFKKCLHE